MNTKSILHTSIEYIKGVGPARAELLQKELNIHYCGDLVMHYPFRYVDRSEFVHIREVQSDQVYVQIKGVISDFREIPMKRGSRLIATLTDSTGSMELVWFKGAQWIRKSIVAGNEYIVFGKPNIFKGKVSLPHPEVNVVTATKLEGGLSPVYPSTELLKKRGIDTKGLAKIQAALWSQLTLEDIPEFLPKSIIEHYQLYPRFASLKFLHFPTNQEVLKRAKIRMKFEEFFLIQLRILKQKQNQQQAFKGFTFNSVGAHFNNFYQNHLPFELTNAQKRVLKEIRHDTKSGAQMNRLVQGDVGSGKTIVALLSMLLAIDNGFQACLMAPTEILAQQHAEEIHKLLKGTGIVSALLTGSVKGKNRKTVLKMLAEGDIQILIGTHAVIQKKVVFQNLGFAVIDEQHRFGVAQRAMLWAKNDQPPHVLVMTATPIPRTLAMTVYGDLDVSVIDELPPGRKPVTTWHKTDSNRLRVFGFLKEQIALGRQVYVVYPLIEESETMDYKDLMDGYESISRAFPIPEYQVSIVHGRMTAETKEYEMQRFVKGETQIMVATTVIEVGVNVPNASVMVIESAERFGLSQLHQLRGRVGRGADQSYCILMTGYKLSKDSKRRMQIMCETTDGFRISEEDLKLRGPGDIEGTRQSGILDLKIADVVKDGLILKEARFAVGQLLEEDPDLSKPQHAKLDQHLKQVQSRFGDWSRIS